MSVVFIDGFDHYLTADLSLKWITDTSGGQVLPDVGASYGRFGSSGCRFSNNFQRLRRVVGASAGFVLSFAFRPATMAAGPRALASFLDGANSQCELVLNTNGTLSVTRNGTAITGATSVASLAVGVFSFIEWKVTVTNSSSGSDNVVRVAGVPVITLPSGSSTKATSNATADTVMIGDNLSGSGYAYDFDDLFVMNSAGSVNNDFIGDRRIEVLRPNGAGNHTDFILGGTAVAASNYASVAEVTENGDTDFVSSTTPGAKDTYQLGNLTGPTLTVSAIQVNIISRKDDAGTRTASALVRTGGVDYAGTPFGVTDSYALSPTVFENNPGTSAAWTPTEINSLEAGVTLVS